ncbi:MAG: HWE histidine kinase domain-containing protein [Ketobacteraceae bacterium]|nr:HWE histidine kinase domain-containing protein [Ketobacteraceae bacterium]
MVAPSDMTEEELLASCASEPIHLIGTIQDYGGLLVLDAEWVIVRASENCGSFLGDSPDNLFGRNLKIIMGSETTHNIRGAYHNFINTGSPGRLLKQRIHDQELFLDICVHGIDNSIIIEFEHHDTNTRQDNVATVRMLLSYLQGKGSLQELMDTGTRLLKLISGYDRVMVYRFLEDGAGEVASEHKETFMASYRGMRFPASDIPPQARELYKVNLLRLISDVDGPRHRIVSADDHQAPPLDLRLSTTRSVSEVHLNYLRNMKVQSSLSVSILIEGELWGLFALHHRRPRVLAFSVRTAMELFAEIFALQVSSLLGQEESAHKAASQRRFHRWQLKIPAYQPALDCLTSQLPAMLDSLKADGVAVWYQERYQSLGICPDEAQMRELIQALPSPQQQMVFTCNNLAEWLARPAPFGEKIAGFMAIAVAVDSNDYIFYFRQPTTETVIWAGDPHHKVQSSGDSSRLQPRASFSEWIETHYDRCDPWTVADCQTAQWLRTATLEVLVRHFHAREAQQSAHQQKRSTLISELNHRVSNILSLVNAIITQSHKSTSDSNHFIEKVEQRIAALALAHNQLTDNKWAPVSLQELLLLETRTLGGDADITLVPPPVNIMLFPESVTPVAMIFHELMTNAIKYGGLSEQGAGLRVLWDVLTDGHLKLLWQEASNQKVTAPEKPGFGTVLIEKIIPYELGGTSTIEFLDYRINVEITIPANHFSTETLPEGNLPGCTERASTGNETKMPATPINSILILDDNLLIALDLEHKLRQQGVKDTLIKSNAPDTLELLQTVTPDAAILDFDLGTHNSAEVARRLKSMHIPFAFVSGYGDTLALPEGLGTSHLIQKPFSVEDINDFLSTISETRHDDDDYAEQLTCH